MRENARQVPPPLPEKRKPKLIEDAGEELMEVSADELIEVNENGDPVVEIDLDLTDVEDVPDTVRDAGMERREKERKERQPLLDALAARGLTTEAALEVIAAFDPERVNDKRLNEEMSEVARSFGVRFEAMSQADREKLMVMYLGARDGRIDASKADVAEALEGGVREQLVGQAFADIAELKRKLSTEVRTADQLKGGLRDVMATLHALSKQLPWSNKENEEVWKQIYNNFNDLRIAKRESGKQGAAEVEGAFREIFEEFSDFIEDEVVAYRMRNGGGSIEDVTRMMYGRTPEEMEAIKVRNREAVTSAMKEMSQKPGVDADMLERLHALNNKGIVPKEFSKLREDEDSIAFFGKAGRLGLLGADVKPYVQEMLDRANDLIDRDSIGQVSKTRFEIEAAKLHNDLLDMHPFGDRNGSTSLLFLELMMTRKGYEPSPERQKDYYKHLGNVLGYNPVAVAVVGYEQYKISNVPGYYEGLQASGEKKAQYDKILALVAKMKERERQQGQGKK